MEQGEAFISCNRIFHVVVTSNDDSAISWNRVALVLAPLLSLSHERSAGSICFALCTSRVDGTVMHACSCNCDTKFAACVFTIHITVRSSASIRLIGNAVTFRDPEGEVVKC